MMMMMMMMEGRHEGGDKGQAMNWDCGQADGLTDLLTSALEDPPC